MFTCQELYQSNHLLSPEGGTSLSKGERPDVQGKEPSVCFANSLTFLLPLSLASVGVDLLPNHAHLPTQARTVFPVVAVRLNAIPSSVLAIWRCGSVTLTCASPVGPQSTGTARWCLAKTAASSVASKR